MQRNAEKAAGGVRALVKDHFDARGVFGGVGYVTSIVAGKTGGEVLRVANVVMSVCGFVPQDVDVTGSWHEGILCACAGI